MNGPEDFEIEPGQPWTVDLFRPEDAEGVARLFLSVYGPDYPIKKFIQPELLIQENAARLTVSSVARTPKGEVVGHNAVFRSAPFERLFEAGAGVVHRHYRGGHGIFTEMVAHGLKFAAQELGAVVTIGEPVCNHVFSQMLTNKLDHRTMAVEVDLMPAAAYDKEKSASGRVSALLDFAIIVPRPHTVFLPAEYEESLRYLYQGLDDPRDLQPSRQPVPVVERTDIKTQYFDFAQVARLAVQSAGPDFLTVLESEERALIDRGVVLIEVWLKMTWPWISEVIAGLRQRKYFFGGLLPRWFDDDGLLMQKRFGRPNWEGMKIHFDRAKEIVRLVREDWERVEAAA